MKLNCIRLKMVKRWLFLQRFLIREEGDDDDGHRCVFPVVSCIGVHGNVIKSRPIGTEKRIWILSAIFYFCEHAVDYGSENLSSFVLLQIPGWFIFYSVKARSYFKTTSRASDHDDSMSYTSPTYLKPLLKNLCIQRVLWPNALYTDVFYLLHGVAKWFSRQCCGTF